LELNWGFVREEEEELPPWHGPRAVGRRRILRENGEETKFWVKKEADIWR
jgi:hypothetical protein